MIEIDGCPRTIVFAHPVNIRWIGLRARVLLLNISHRPSGCGVVCRLQLILRTWCRAEIIEPMEVSLNECDRDVGIQVVRRNDVQYSNPRYFIRMIQRQAVSDSSTPIVADNRERVVAEMLHHLDLVQCHRSLRVVRVILSVRRLAAVAVTTEI